MRKVPRRTGGAPSGAGRLALVDSGAWIALVRAADAHHDEADGMFRQAVRKGVRLLTTNLIVAEVHRFILFHAGPRAASLVLERMEESPSLTIVFATAEHHEKAGRWLSKLTDQRITYTDAVSFAVMDAQGCKTAMSFDRDFTIAGFSLWSEAVKFVDSSS